MFMYMNRSVRVHVEARRQPHMSVLYGLRDNAITRMQRKVTGLSETPRTNREASQRLIQPPPLQASPRGALQSPALGMCHH